MNRAVLHGLLALVLIGCSPSEDESYSRGDPPPASEDDPSTTNDESNDQPTGYYGSATVCALSWESGNTYSLDVSVENGVLTEVYFPKGGNVDFYSCELDEALEGDCLDEEGRSWTFQGESTGYCGNSSRYVSQAEQDEADDEADRLQQEQDAAADAQALADDPENDVDAQASDQSDDAE